MFAGQFWDIATHNLIWLYGPLSSVAQSVQICLIYSRSLIAGQSGTELRVKIFLVLVKGVGPVTLKGGNDIQ